MKAMEESGYLLERQVATELEGLRFHVKTNDAFEDQEEGQTKSSS
jgi:hypothetical protein